MVKKLQKSGDGAKAASSTQLAATVKESAQQIWLAGLGAFSKAQEEGGKVFEALVKEGVTLQKRTQAVAEGKLSEATTRMSSMATDLSTRASGQWDKLEGIFEDRVSKALKKLGVPTSRDVDALVKRIDELQRTVASLQGGGSARKTAAKRTPATKAVARKRAPARKAAG
ncbi:phasin family protein [Ramlibacter sp. USB13]|uniref:Phasin family protein n=1 Tax=Ramlibacter cellulosilyticus TaxID=2764187 RepID=A0A923MWE7_9BURK|nr:phasin family protein [Ramlibacter cellulosilyticus]MBC5786291.1 phasin family protein [Ramlibacter cellulosilyticus]